MAELHHGVIRGKQARIEFTGPISAEVQFVVARVASPSGDAEVVLPLPAAEVVEGQAKFILELPLSRCPMPISRIDILLRSPGGDEELKAGEGYALDRLFPASEREFAANFTWEGQRIRDPETLRFAAAQVVQHSGFGASHVGAAAAIVAYRSLDSGDIDHCREALAFVDASIARLPELGSTRHVRTDRDHMTISLYVIRWHLCLSLGRPDEVMASLEAGYQALRPIEDAWSVGYNGSKLLLLYGFLLWQQGRLDKAGEVFDFAFHLFKRVSANSSNDNATLFNDHRVSHRIAFLGMVAKLQMAKKPTPGGTLVDQKTVADETFRVRDRRALARLREQLDAMCREFAAAQASDPGSDVQSSIVMSR